MKRTFKKTICGVLAAVSVLGCATTMSACESAHPEVEIEIAFNGETYTLEYTLYRRTAPSTVAHFLYLAGNGYYDGLCVHDYRSADRLYTGEYTADKTDATEIVRKNYLNTISAFDDFDEFPSSVWEDREMTISTYTLKGEFLDNGGFDVKSGALSESFGSLAMYYYNYDTTRIPEKKIYAVRSSEEGAVDKRDYQYNLATSAFFISLKTTNPTNDDYCTFATLDEDSREVLKDLQAAIEDYIEDHYADDESSFTHLIEKQVFEHDSFLSEYKQTESFNVPKEPIVIKKVEVTKY